VRPLEPQSEPVLEAQPVALPGRPDDEHDASLLGLLVEPEAPSSAPRQEEPPPDFTVAAPGELAGLAPSPPLPPGEVRRGLATPIPPQPLDFGSDSASLAIEVDAPEVDPSEPSFRRMTPRSGLELTDSSAEAYGGGDDELSMPGDAVVPMEPPPDWLHPALDAEPPREEVEDTRALPKITPTPRLRIAPLWRRLGALGVDAGVGVAFVALAAVSTGGALALPAGDLRPEVLVDLLLDASLGRDAAIGLGVAFGLATALNASLGASIGKLVFGLEIVRRGGAAVRPARGALRGLLSLPGLALLGAGVAWVIVDRRCRAWHDLVAGTVVVCRGSASKTPR
jgi:uncharacterized RDD family membrane protein YckC